jgi:hypothetical protein
MIGSEVAHICGRVRAALTEHLPRRILRWDNLSVFADVLYDCEFEPSGSFVVYPSRLHNKSRYHRGLGAIGFRTLHIPSGSLADTS